MSAGFIISVVPVHDAVIQVFAGSIKAGDLLARGDHYEVVESVHVGGKQIGAKLASGPSEHRNLASMDLDMPVFIFDLQRAARYVYGLDPDDGYGDEVAFAHENAVPR